MTKAKTAVDIDDTLYSFTNAARVVMCNWPGVDGPMFRRAGEAPWRVWDCVEPLCDNRFVEVIRKMQTREAILAMSPYPDSVATLQKIASLGGDLHYISSRPEDTYQATWDWLSQQGFPVSDQMLTCTFQDKTPLVPDCQYIIDDRCRTLVQFVYDFQWKNTNPDLPRLGFAIQNDLNCGLADVPGIHLASNWNELEKLLAQHTDLLT